MSRGLAARLGVVYSPNGALTTRGTLGFMALSDTAPAIERIVIEGYRAMTPAQKLARVEDLRRVSLGLAEARIRREYPQASEREVLMRSGGPGLIAA